MLIFVLFLITYDKVIVWMMFTAGYFLILSISTQTRQHVGLLKYICAICTTKDSHESPLTLGYARSHQTLEKQTIQDLIKELIPLKPIILFSY